ncbi:MAG TPA: NAD-dependent epimerase/dehydratase family protein [Patescibacteria group bacterium]|nr:NAD-dependent epimerase/dehydratase family protein [Patescibacteria group bacterium]
MGKAQIISRWSYGFAKALGEEYLFGLHDEGLKFSIVRYFNCYGPRGINKRYLNVIPKFILQALKEEFLMFQFYSKNFS